MRIDYNKLLSPLALISLAFAAAAAVLVFFGQQTSTCFDVWWHLKAGEWIFLHHTVPYTEMWSWTASGAPWVAHEWLSELIFYLAHRVAGLQGLVLVGALTLAAALVATARYLERENVKPWIIWMVLALVVAGVLPRFRARPDIFDFALLPVVLCLLQTKRYWGLAPVALLWANLHGGSLPVLYFLAGLEILALLRRQEMVRAAQVAAFTVGPVLINPFGAKMLVYPFIVAANPLFSAYITEWASPTFHLNPENCFAFIFLGVVFVCLWAAQKHPRVLVSVLSFALLGFSAVRHIALFYIAALPQAVVAKVGEGGTKPCSRQASLVAGVLAAVLVVEAAVLVPAETLSAPPDEFPTAAVEHLRPDDRLFNLYAWGGYLVWRGVPVFIDGRADIYAEKVFPDYLQASRGENWREVFARYGVTAVLLPPRGPLALILRETQDWQVDYEDRTAVLFRKGE